MTALRDQYPAGSRHRVLRDGARLTGLVPKPGYQQGWSCHLAAGDVIEAAGYGPGWGSDPGYGIHFRVPGVNFAEFQPSQGGAFNFGPADGWLEAVADDTPLTELPVEEV